MNAPIPAHRNPLLIGIAGGTGSGKSTVARNVAAALGTDAVVFIEMDAYYRDLVEMPMDDRKRLNFDHPDAFDIELLIEHLGQLARGEAVEVPVYEFHQHVRAAHTQRIEPAPVVVIDGILLFADERLRALLDVKVFVDADADVRLARRIRRDIGKRGRQIDDILEQYFRTVQPMHLQFVEPSKRYADVIVPRGGQNMVAVEMIVAMILRRLVAGQP